MISLAVDALSDTFHYVPLLLTVVNMNEDLSPHWEKFGIVRILGYRNAVQIMECTVPSYIFFLLLDRMSLSNLTSLLRASSIHLQKAVCNNLNNISQPYKGIFV